MGLIQPSGPSWAYCTHNLPSSLTPTSLGASCTAGASHADGTAVEMLPALAHDVEYLRLAISVTATASDDNNALLDLLIDPAGGDSWAVLIEDLIAGGGAEVSAVSTALGGPGIHYDFPLWIPAGASLGIRARGARSSGSPVIKVAAFAFGGNRNPASWWCGQRVSSINAAPSTSNGGLHTAGSSTAFSSWADLGSPLGAACGALQYATGGQSAGAWSNGTGPQYQFEFGGAGQRIGPPLYRWLGTAENGFWLATGPIFQQLAAGTQLQVRGACIATAAAVGVMAYAVH